MSLYLKIKDFLSKSDSLAACAKTWTDKRWGQEREQREQGADMAALAGNAGAAEEDAGSTPCISITLHTWLPHFRNKISKIKVVCVTIKVFKLTMLALFRSFRQSPTQSLPTCL